MIRILLLFSVLLTTMCFSGATAFAESADSVRTIKELAASQGSLTLEEVLSSVAIHHPALKTEVLGIESAEGRQLSALGSFDPKIKSKTYNYLSGYYGGGSTDNRLEVPIEPAFGQVFGGYRKGSGILPVYEDEYQTLNGGEFGIGVSFSLLRNLVDDTRKVAIDLARYDRELAELGLTSAQIKLQQLAVQHYWAWAIQGKITAIFKELLRVAEVRQKQLNQQVDAGSLAAFEALDNRRSILQRKAKVLKQEALFVEVSQALSLFLRTSSGEPRVPLPRELPARLPSAQSVTQQQNELLQEALLHRVDIQKFQTKTAQLERQLSFEETRVLPEVELAGTLSRDDGAGSVTREGTESKIYLNVEVPLRQRKARGKVREVEAKLDQNRMKERFLREQVEAELPVFLNQIQQSVARYKVSNQEWDATRKLEQGERTRFESGDSNMLFLAMRELAAAEGRVHVLEALADNLSYRAKLDASLGRTRLPELLG